VLPRYTKRRKQGGQVQIILFHDENFIRGRFNSIDDSLIIDRIFDFYHEIRRYGLHPMVFMHVMNYFLCYLAVVQPGCLE